MAFTELLPPLPNEHCILLFDKSEDQINISLKRRIPFVSLLKPWLLGAIVGFVLGLIALLMYQYESDFAVLSVPFWIISLILLTVFLNHFFEKQEVKFTLNQVLICKKRPFSSPKLLLHKNDNYDVSLLADKKGEEVLDQKVPVIFFRLEAFSFFEYATLEEKKWIVNVLEIFKKTTL